MSAIAAALAFLHARKWLVEILLGVALVGGLWIAYDRQIDKAEVRGMTQQQAADDMATALLRKKVDELTAQNVALAAAAKAKYDSDHAANLTAAVAPVGVSQLCPPPSPHGSEIGLSQASAPHAGNGSGAAAAAVVQPVSAADNGLAEDRRRLLGALAALSDDDSAVIREFQKR